MNTDNIAKDIKNTNDIHIFEEAGLGKAPFSFQYVWQMPHPSMMEGIGGVEMYNNQMKSAPCRVGCCHFCGMPLIYHYIIKSSDNKTFAVGCECVNKSTDAGLKSQIAKAKREMASQKRLEKKNSKRIEQINARKALIASKIDSFKGEYPRAYDFLQSISEQSAPIFHSFLYQLQTYGNLSINQINIIHNQIEEDKKPKTISQFIGQPKDKISTTVTMEKIITVPCSSFHYNDRASIDIYIMKDQMGNQIIYKSKTIATDKKKGINIDQGMTVNVAATIKELNSYKGINQTIIQRPTWSVKDW